MPSMIHEALVALFRNCPMLAPEVLRETLGVPLPAFTEARVESIDLTEVVPRELRADQVVVLYNGRTPLLSIVVEVQRKVPRKSKLRAWVSYVAGAFVRYRCPACLLVVTTHGGVAARSAKLIEVGPGSVVRPWVLGPISVPAITAPAKAQEMPELAVLSVMAHGRSEAGLQIALAALAGAAGLDEERATLYEDVVLSCLSQAARRALEEMMASGEYQIQSKFLKKYIAKGERKGKAEGITQGKAKGKAECVLTVLEARGLAVSDEVRQRVLASSDLAELDRWVRRAAVVGAAGEIFAQPT